MHVHMHSIKSGSAGAITLPGGSIKSGSLPPTYEMLASSTNNTTVSAIWLTINK